MSEGWLAGHAGVVPTLSAHRHRYSGFQMWRVGIGSTGLAWTTRASPAAPSSRASATRALCLAISL